MGMATFIWMGIVLVWAWHVIDLFREVDPSELPPRARLLLGDAADLPVRTWAPEHIAHAGSATR